MKMTVILFLMILHTVTCFSQTADEWFRQKKTQNKYLADQIAALKVYSEYVKKGYQVVHIGLSTIEQIKDGNFSLDQVFMDARKIANPAIRNSAKVACTIGYHAMSVRDFRKVIQFIKENGNFSPDEVSYIGLVFTNLLRTCDASLLELRDVISDGNLQMTDDERMMRVDVLYDDAQSTYSFVQAFGNEARILAQQRAKQLFDTQTSGQLNQ